MRSTATATLLGALACSEPPAPPPPSGELTFVRGGVITPGVGHSGQPLPDGRQLVSQPWSPGAPVQMDGLFATAPAQPACVRLFSVAMPGVAPGAGLAFIGNDVIVSLPNEPGRVVDGWRGRLRSTSMELPAELVLQTTPAPEGVTSDGATLVVGGARCALPSAAVVVAVADDLRVAALTVSPPELVVFR